MSVPVIGRGWRVVGCDLVVPGRNVGHEASRVVSNHIVDCYRADQPRRNFRRLRRLFQSYGDVALEEFPELRLADCCVHDDVEVDLNMFNVKSTATSRREHADGYIFFPYGVRRRTASLMFAGGRYLKESGC
jgi:hypothetical protein